MRTALDLPDGLVDEARAAMGFASKTETVAHALREMVRRNRLEELKAMFGTVNIDVDIPCPTEETWALIERWVAARTEGSDSASAIFRSPRWRRSGTRWCGRWMRTSSGWPD